jgi:predicted phage-related endonuclease
MDIAPPPDPAEIYRRLGFRPDGLADLSGLGLDEASILARRNFIGGSDAKIIVSGDPAAMNNLALQKRGLRGGDDLSRVMYVQLGQWTEPFTLAWAERDLGVRFTRRGERVHAPRQPWMAATLDAYVEDYRGLGPRVVQAKHVNAWSKIDEVVETYRPQVTHEAHCLGAEGTLLCVLIGTSKLEILDVELDLPYLTDLIAAEERFWEAVQAGVNPAAVPMRASGRAKVTHAVRVGERDMTGSNAWAVHAATWLATVEPAGKHEKATDELKKLVPADVAKAFGAGVTAKVAKNGAVRLSKTDDEESSKKDEG